jgi:hypothetical protein
MQWTVSFGTGRNLNSRFNRFKSLSMQISVQFNLDKANAFRPEPHAMSSTGLFCAPAAIRDANLLTKDEGSKSVVVGNRTN